MMMMMMKFLQICGPRRFPVASRQENLSDAECYDADHDRLTQLVESEFLTSVARRMIASHLRGGCLYKPWGRPEVTVATRRELDVVPASTRCCCSLRPDLRLRRTQQRSGGAEDDAFEALQMAEDLF